MRSGFLGLCLALLLLVAALPGTVLAQEQGATAPPDWVVARVELGFTGLSGAALAGGFGVHQATLDGTPRTAEDLRTIHANAALYGQGDAVVRALEDGLRARVEAALEGLFPEAEVTIQELRVVPESLEPAAGASDPHHPPVRFVLAAAVAWPPPEVAGVVLDDAKVQAVFRLGAKVAAPAVLAAPAGWNATYVFQLPPWLRASAAEGATLAPDGGQATWELRNWRGAAALRVPTALYLEAREAPEVEATDARVALAIDMADVSGLSVPGLLSGELGALDVRFEALVTARALRLADVPVLDEALQARLPAGFELGGVNADGLRLALRDGLVPESALERLEDHFRGLALERLAGLQAGQVELRGGLDPASVSPNGLSRPLDGDPPLTYRVGATFKLPLGGRSMGGDPRVQAAALGPALVERELTLPLPRVQGLDTTYRVTLPPGIALAAIEADGARVERGEDGGRDYVLLTPERDDASATFHVAVTADFVLAKFWYLWLGLLLLVLVGVAAVLAHKLRQRGKGAEHEEDAGPEALDEAPELPVPGAQPEAAPDGAGPRP